jgi:hypothetical protein
MAKSNLERIRDIIDSATPSPEHENAVINEFGNVGSETAKEIHNTLYRVRRDYTTATKFAEARTLTEYRNKYSTMGSAARKLANLLRQDPVSYYHHYVDCCLREMEEEAQKPIDLLVPDFRGIERKWATFIDILDWLEAETNSLVGDPAYLKKVAGTRPTRGNKSRERFYIWEPIFELWRASGRKVGFSPKGPLMRILNTVHAGLGIPSPSAASVHQAVRDFQKDQDQARDPSSRIV